MRFTRQRWLAAALAIISIALIAAGCGGSSSNGRLSKKDYVDKNNAAQQKVAGALTALQKNNSSDPAVVAKEADQLKAQIDSAAKDLEKLKPPTDWQDEHAQFLKGMHDTSTAMAHFAAAARAKDVKGMGKTLQELNAAGSELDKATNSMNASR